MENKVKIGNDSKVTVKWDVLPIDYSRDAEKTIIEKFSKKYGIKKENIKVDANFIKKDEDGNAVPMTNDITANIQDASFQQKLFKEYLKEFSIENYDFEKIVEIDNLINNSINYEVYDSNKRFSLKWIKWSNFMSYGENNYFDFTNLKGLVLLTSEPANQGGKSTFCLDLFRFLLFGKVTSRENDWTLSKVFNKYLPEATDVIVEGCITINGDDYVIKRVVSRPSLKKRTSKSKVTQKLTYYRVVNDELLELEDYDNQQDTTVTNTNKLIKEAIGNERDFDLMICVNSDNLKGLISLKDTDRGRLISRWIGLLPLEDKDKIARETYNKTIVPSLLLNRYNSEELKNSIKDLEDENTEVNKELDKLKAKKKESEDKLVDLNKAKENLLLSKTKIDENLSKEDVKTIENTLVQIKERGTRKRAEKAENEKKLSEIKYTEFNEAEYKEVDALANSESINLATMRQKLVYLKKEIDMLKNSEFCPTCGAKLKDVDNTESIRKKTEEYNKLIEDGKAKKIEVDALFKKKENLNAMREEYNAGIRLKLIIEKNEVDIENLISQYKEKKQILKDIEANKTAIENNNKIETSLNIVNTNIINETRYLNTLISSISDFNNQILGNNKSIKQYDDIIKTLDEETKLVRNWKLYLDMIGKNGISKMVIRNVLPLINGELKRLLNGVCDFYVEVSIDEHNDIAFTLIHDGVEANLSSGSGFEQTVASLALRSVLSRISTFSKPSFVIFDEILGGVSDENYEQVKLLYDKIVTDYDFIFQITHLKQIADWHNQTVIVRKENNISKILTA